MSIDQKIATLMEDASKVSDQAVARVESALILKSRAARRRRAVVLSAAAGTVCAGAVLAVAGAVVGSSGHHSDARVEAGRQPEQPSDFMPLPVKPGEPCPMAREVSLADLEASSRTPIWMPHDSRANPQRLTHSWDCGGTPVLSFGPFDVGFEDGWSGVDMAAKWADMAAEQGGSVTEVGGRPALFEPARDAGSVNELLFVIGDTLVRVSTAQSGAEHALVGIARSIDVDHPMSSPTG